jgi:hypothetical protein
MKEVRRSLESKVNGHRLQNEVCDKGDHCSWFSLITVPQAGIKDTSAGGLMLVVLCYCDGSLFITTSSHIYLTFLESQTLLQLLLECCLERQLFA